MNTEPSRLIALVTAAIATTIGVFTASGVISPEVGGGISAALGAWVAVAGEIVRSRVTPNVNVAMTTVEEKELTEAGFGPAPRVVAALNNK